MHYDMAMARRTQTLVQLTEDLVERLDRVAAGLHISRSRLIRDILEQHLAVDREAEVTRRIIEGYRQVPQSEGVDAWGDLEAWNDANALRNLRALDDEEVRPW